jgi:hypothetical protein
MPLSVHPSVAEIPDVLERSLNPVDTSRHAQRTALPCNKQNAMAGSVAAPFGGWLGCLLVFWIFESFGFLMADAGL